MSPAHKLSNKYWLWHMTILLVGKKISDLKWIAKCEFCEGPIIQSFPVADTGNGGAFVF